LTYLLIAFAIAVALAPLSYFAPSKRQREIARMREYAAVHGMFVEFRQVPGRYGGGLGKREGALRDTIYYGKRLPPSKGKGEDTLIWLLEAGCWAGLEHRSAVPPALQSLAAPVLAASVGEGSCGVYWRESGGVEAVELIRQVLESWAGQLRQ
jgi:hypothetical protein